MIVFYYFVFFFLMIRRPPRSTRMTHSFPTRRSSDLVTYPEGNSVEYTYDARDNVTGTIAHPKTGSGTISTSATYSSTCTNPKKCNKPETTTDANDTDTNYEYNTRGQATNVTHPEPAVAAARTEQRDKIESAQGRTQA